MTDRDIYKCKNCGFEFFSPKKEYDKCPECGSEHITKIRSTGDSQPVNRLSGRGQGSGRGAMGANPPRVCKCFNCGYEASKIPGTPCRNSKCPECGAPLCGSD